MAEIKLWVFRLRKIDGTSMDSLILLASLNERDLALCMDILELGVWV